MILDQPAGADTIEAALLLLRIAGTPSTSPATFTDRLSGRGQYGFVVVFFGLVAHTDSTDYSVE